MAKFATYGRSIAGVLSLCIAQYSNAAPSIKGVEGAVSQGETITISGSGFGSRSNATPFYWSDFESATVGQNALQAGLDDLGTDGQGLPYVRNDLALSGTKSLRMDYLQNKDSMFPRVGKNGLNATEVYVSVWTYWKRTAGNGGAPFIFKLVRGGTNPAYSGVPRFYETIRPNDSGTVTGSDRGSVNSSGTTTWAQDVNAGQNAGGWHRSEYYFKLSTPGVADGVFKTWVDGTLNSNLTATMSRTSGTSALINYVMSPFDGNDSYGMSNAYSVWVDDFYIDTTRARVELGDASTLSASKKRYILPSTKWSDGSVSVKVNLSTFTSGAKAYLYVFDASGNANSSGYPVTIGAADSKKPDAPVLTTVQ